MAVHACVSLVRPDLAGSKLRMLCCCAQIEKAGGYSSADGKCISGLDVQIKAYDQRTQICYGSMAEVREIPGVAAVRGCCGSWMVSLAAAPCRV